MLSHASDPSAEEAESGKLLASGASLLCVGKEAGPEVVYNNFR